MLAAALTRLATAHNTDKITSAGYWCSSSSGRCVDHLHAPNATVVSLPEHLLPPITFGSKQKPFFLFSTQLITSLGPGLHDHTIVDGGRGEGGGVVVLRERVMASAPPIRGEGDGKEVDEVERGEPGGVPDGDLNHGDERQEEEGRVPKEASAVDGKPLATEADSDDTMHGRGDEHGAAEHDAVPHGGGRPSSDGEGGDGGERVGRAVAER